MRNWIYTANSSGLFLAFLVMLFLLVTATPGISQESRGNVQLEWLTWSFFRITSPTGKVILTNPWVTNPDSQTTLDDIQKADVILVPTGHRDEVGETVEIANKTDARLELDGHCTRHQYARRARHADSGPWKSRPPGGQDIWPRGSGERRRSAWPRADVPVPDWCPRPIPDNMFESLYRSLRRG